METHWTRQPIQQLKMTQTWMGHIFVILGMLGDPPDTKGFFGNVSCNRSLVSREIDIVPSGSWSRWRWRTIASWLLRRLTAERKHLSFASRFQNWIPSISMIFIVLSCFIPSKKMVIWRVYPIVRHNTSWRSLHFARRQCLVCRNPFLMWDAAMPPWSFQAFQAFQGFRFSSSSSYCDLLAVADGNGLRRDGFTHQHLSTSLNLHWKCTGSSNSRTSTELMDAYILFTYYLHIIYILFTYYTYFLF